MPFSPTKDVSVDFILPILEELFSESLTLLFTPPKIATGSQEGDIS